MRVRVAFKGSPGLHWRGLEEVGKNKEQKKQHKNRDHGTGGLDRRNGIDFHRGITKERRSSMISKKHISSSQCAHRFR